MRDLLGPRASRPQNAPTARAVFRELALIHFRAVRSLRREARGPSQSPERYYLLFSLWARELSPRVIVYLNL